MADYSKRGMPLSQGDPYDAAARRIGETAAQSRFTKTPIRIINTHKLASDIVDGSNGAATLIPNGQTQTEGEYYPSTKTIDVTLAGTPSYADLNNTIHHEDIHALLDGAHVSPHDPKPLKPLPELFRSLTSGEDVSDKARAGFRMGRRGGDERIELPAYVGAYRPGQLTDFTQSDQENWLSRYLPTIDQNTQTTLSRIIDSNSATPGVGPTGRARKYYGEK